MKQQLRSFFHDEEGQALAELALAVPLLLLVVLAIVDFGRAINYWNDENHAANIGARYAAVGNWPQCNGQAQATLAAYVLCQAGQDSNNNLSQGSGGNNGIQNGGASVCISAVGATVGSSASVGMPVTVLVRSSYRFLPLIGVANSTIDGKATMRLEQPLAANVVTQSGQCT